MHNKITKYFFISLSLTILTNLSFSQETDSLKVEISRAGVVPDDTIKAILPNDTLLTVDTVNLPPKNTSNAIEAPVEYLSTDSIIFNMPERKIYVYGKGDIVYEDIKLQSEYIELDMNNREVFAKGVNDSLGKEIGSPIFQQGNEIYDADTLRYNFKSKKGLAYGIITEQDEGFLHSKKTKIHEDKQIHMVGGKYTTCDLEHPHFYIGMTKAKVIPNKQIVTGPAYIVIEDVPLPLIIPFGFFPTKKGRSNGILMPSYGDDATKGYYFKDGGVYFGFSDYADFTLKGEIYTLGSWMLDASSNYKLRYKFSGNLRVEYSSIVIDEIKQPSTYRIVWNHTQDQKAKPNSNFSANVNYQSMGHQKYTAKTENELVNNTIRSSISYRKKFGNSPFNLNLSFLHNQKSTDSTISFSLPNLTFSMNSQTPFKRKNGNGKIRFYENIRIGYTLTGVNSLKNAKLDSVFYTMQTLSEFEQAFQHVIPISTSLKLFKYLSINPSFNFTDRMYFMQKDIYWNPSKSIDTTGANIGGLETDTIPGFFNVYNYSYSIGLTTKLYGMFTFKSKVVKAIRHIITPNVSFSYTPDFGTDRYGYFDTYEDKYGELVTYSKYTGAVYGAPASSEVARMGFSIGNNLEMKVRDKKDTITGTKKVKLIESFSISSSYDFLADSLKLGYINVSAYTTLFKRFKINYSGTLDPYAWIYNKSEDKLVRSGSYMFDNYGRPWRIDNTRWSTGGSFRLGPIKENKKHIVEREGSYHYSRFEVPWSLSLGYNLSLPRKYYYNADNELDSVSTDITQSLSIRGNFSLTENWNITFSTGWDFANKGLTYTSIDIYRDLHCWEMSLNWVPIGTRQRWEFVIRIKASMFQDVKYEIKSPNTYF